MTVTITQTLTISPPVFAVPKGIAPRKRKFSTLSNLAPEEPKFAIHTGPAPKKGNFLVPWSPKSVEIEPQIFKVPKNPPVKYVLSPMFYKETKRKIQSLMIVMKNPRSRLPANRKVIQTLLDFLRTLLKAPNPVSTAENCQQHEVRMHVMKMLEETVIRIVIQGEELEVVKKEIEGRILRNC